MAKAEVDQATKNTAVQTIKQNLINMQAEGALKIVGKDLSVAQARMIERELQLLGYKATTERMSAEAAKKQASNIQGEIDLFMSNDVGAKFHVQLWSVKLKTSSEVPFISDDWGKIDSEFTLQVDSANHPDSPYGLITPLGES